MKITKILVYIFFFSVATLHLSAQTIEEKKANAAGEADGAGTLLIEVNKKLAQIKGQIDGCYQRAKELVDEEASEEEYRFLLSKVHDLKAEFSNWQLRWREKIVSQAKGEEEGYGLWDQEETTLAQLVTEYGAADYLYIVPADLANIKLNMHSNIPIPRESWSEVLEILLSQSGVGVKQVNPFVRQLFQLKQDPGAVQAVLSKFEELAFLKGHERIAFVLACAAEQTRAVFQFFERFADPKQTFIYQVAGKVMLVGLKDEIERLLALYKVVWQPSLGKLSRVVPITKMHVKEMEKILTSFFGDAVEKLGRPTFGKVDYEGLAIVTPTQGNALVLIGNKELVARAEKVIKETEEQLQDPAEMTVFLYTCKHSNPADLAKILDKVYYSLVYALPEARENVDVAYSARGQGMPPDGYAPSQPLVVPPQTFKPEVSTKLEVEQGNDHFIPDPKTGNLLMVVRRDVLNKIKDLLRKLDIPKKMVQIEVLLFEKKLNRQSSFGLNLLKLGSSKNGARYDGPSPPGPKGLASPVGEGVLAFLFSGKKSKHFPAFDLAYSFLMTQEDIQLNTAPSVITVNQTPATIAILEEISINNGAAPIDTNKGIAFEKSFTRAQYGITIILTPIVHLPDEEAEGEKGFVTLQTNITFDTTKTSSDDRPPVDKRHIENEVRVQDGETVILGGLRRRATQDNQDKVPFLGEIPGLGKLFGSTKLMDNNTEMFFFITPRIVLDPKEQLLQIRRDELKKRPGDIPEFLQKVVDARDREAKRCFAQSMRLLFSR